MEHRLHITPLKMVQILLIQGYAISTACTITADYIKNNRMGDIMDEKELIYTAYKVKNWCSETEATEYVDKAIKGENYVIIEGSAEELAAYILVEHFENILSEYERRYKENFSVSPIYEALDDEHFIKCFSNRTDYMYYDKDLSVLVIFYY